MAPPGLPELPARGAGSPCSAGRLLGARLLELGRLRPSSVEELLVIEASPATGRAASSRRPARSADGAWGAPRPSPSPAWPASEEAEQEEADPILEADLALEDFDAEQDASLRDLWAALPDPWAPGSARGRELMAARAKQCVICMEEKEHTLVPPHKGSGEGMHLEGHRVCTGCWEDLLQHELDRQWGRQGPLPALTCPVCRAGVMVPDAWDVALDLPEEWVQRSAPHLAGCRPLGDAPAARLEPSQKWATAAAEGAGRGAADSVAAAAGAGAAGPARRCSPSWWRWLCCGSHASSEEELLAGAAEVSDAPVPPL